MPKAFSEEESNRIRQALLAAGRARFPRYGVRKTTVEELTQAAGISKGAFYRFFESKELLYLEVLEEAEQRMRGDLMAAIRQGAGLSVVLDTLLNGLREEPLFRQMVEPGEMEYLVGRVGMERMGQHVERDNTELTSMVRLLQAKGMVRTALDPEVVAELLRALVAIPFLEPRMQLGRREEVYALLTSALQLGLGDEVHHA